MSLNKNQYYFVAYDYDNNYIFAIPILDLNDVTIIKAFDGIFNELTEQGHKANIQCHWQPGNGTTEGISEKETL